MSEIDRARALAQSEFNQHEADYTRLQGIVNMVLHAMEFHAAQMSRWQVFLGNLVEVEPINDPIPAQRAQGLEDA